MQVSNVRYIGKLCVYFVYIFNWCLYSSMFTYQYVRIGIVYGFLVIECLIKTIVMLF